MKARRPLRTRSRPNPVNRERRSRLSEVQYGPEAFVTWIHRAPCSIPGCDARDVEQAHAKSRAAGGTWEDTLPLCRDHHREQHDIGLLTFERKHGVDLRLIARMVQRAWADQQQFPGVARKL